VCVCAIKGGGVIKYSKCKRKNATGKRLWELSVTASVKGLYWLPSVLFLTFILLQVFKPEIKEKPKPSSNVVQRKGEIPIRGGHRRSGIFGAPVLFSPRTHSQVSLKIAIAWFMLPILGNFSHIYLLRVGFNGPTPASFPFFWSDTAENY